MEWKNAICLTAAAFGSWIASLFGGWDAGLATLVICMAIDYVSGLAVAGIFKNSKKTQNGALESNVGWKGIAKKCMTLFFVLIAYRLDILIGKDYVRDAVIIFFVVNEVISIAENAGLMGVPFPPAIKRAIEALSGKDEEQA